MLVAPLPVGRLLSLGCFGPLVVLLVLLLQILVPRRVLTIGPHVFRMILAALGSISMHRLHVSFHSPPSANGGHTKDTPRPATFPNFSRFGRVEHTTVFHEKGLARAEGRLTRDPDPWTSARNQLVQRRQHARVTWGKFQRSCAGWRPAFYVMPLSAEAPGSALHRVLGDMSDHKIATHWHKV
jgi:hypothetical protein